MLTRAKNFEIPQERYCKLRSFPDRLGVIPIQIKTTPKKERASYLLEGPSKSSNFFFLLQSNSFFSAFA